MMQQGRTFVALNTHATPTAAFVTQPDWQFPAGSCESAITTAVGQDHMGLFDAEQVAVKALGDSIYTNPLLLGYAWQAGRVPLSLDALMRAMELNGVQIDNNKAAFEWGRRCAHDLTAVRAHLQVGVAASQVIEFAKRTSLGEMVSQRVNFLTDYQNAAYAAQYQALVDQVKAAEAPLGKTTLTEAVARYYFKLMAYKDEYEVARLQIDKAFLARIGAQFEGDFKLHHHLAPPLFSGKNDAGELKKSKFGPWVRVGFHLLAPMKFLRGTPFDIFGYADERREERSLVRDYRAAIEGLLPKLTADNRDAAVVFAKVPEQIRGYGHVKARHLASARPLWDAALQKFYQA